MSLSTTVIIVTSPLGERKVFSNLKAAIESTGLNYQYLLSQPSGRKKADRLSKSNEKDGTFKDGDGFEHKGWRFEKFYINKKQAEFNKAAIRSNTSERLYRRTNNLFENSKKLHYLIFDKGVAGYPNQYRAMGFVDDMEDPMASIHHHNLDEVRKQLWKRGFHPKQFEELPEGILQAWTVQD